MNKHANPPRWYQPWRRTDAQAMDDPADLGTCFGMEVMLAAEPAPTKTGAGPRRVGWMQRFASRRRAAV